MADQPVHIGIGQDAAWYPFNGMLDEIRIYNRALSEAEIQELYQLPIYSISGQVTDGDSNPISGVTIFDDAGHTTATDSDGCYTLSGLAAGTYTLTPSKSGWTFSPATRTVSVPPDATGQDFTGSGPTLTLELPWTAGVGWHFTGGPHPSLGSPVWDALDFMPCDGDRTVRAAADGVVGKVDQSLGNLQIDHENGWSTFYGHLETINVTTGMTVTAGQPVAIAGSRGATNVHLHFGLKHNGAWAPIGNGDISLSGWRVYAGTLPYTGYLERAGMRITAGGGCYQTDNIVSTYFAEDAGTSHQLFVSPGENFHATIRVVNAGQTTWTEGDQVRLGLLEWNDSMGAGIRQSLAPGESVSPGEVRIWTIPMTAPNEPGTYWQVWRIVREDGKIGWFGERIQVEVYVATETVESAIPPSGGSLTSNDGNTTLSFPPNSVTNAVVITYRSLPPIPTGHLIGIGHFFDLTAVYSDTGQLAQLAPGVSYTVTIAYTSNGPAIEDTLALYWWDGSRWSQQGITSAVDTTSDVVTAQVDHFSLFAVLGETKRIYLPLVLKNH